jgi:hypothetical protein
MRYALTCITILLLTTTLCGQQQKKTVVRSSWRDTTLIPVKLTTTIKDNKVVVVEVGKKATIYLAIGPMLVEAKENLSNDFVKEYYAAIIHYFDSAFLKRDTVVLSNCHELWHFEYLVATQLMNGNARVFYKKQKAFVPTISHRLERYGGCADRFFYLPDRLPFFATREFSGILDNDEDLTGKGHFEAYVNEGDKLQSLKEE